MNAYELISPKTNRPCGVFVCGQCNLVAPNDLVDRCCKPCDCGKPSRNRFEAKCSDCADAEYYERRANDLEKAELVEWDGSMIFSEVVEGYRDGWFDSPDDLRDYLAEREDEDRVQFAFLGRRCVRELDLDRAIEQMTEDTYEDAEVNASLEDMTRLRDAVDAFNARCAITYFEHDYSKKVRIDDFTDMTTDDQITTKPRR